MLQSFEVKLNPAEPHLEKISIMKKSQRIQLKELTITMFVNILSMIEIEKKIKNLNSKLKFNI